MGYDYYSYAYSGTEDMAAFGGLIVVLILFYVLMMAFSVVCSVLQALAGLDPGGESVAPGQHF